MKLEDVPNASDDELINEWNLFITSKISAVPRTLILSVSWLLIYFFFIRSLVLKLNSWLSSLIGYESLDLALKLDEFLSELIGFEYSFILLIYDVMFIVIPLRILWTIYYSMFKENDLEVAKRRSQKVSQNER